MAYPVAEFTLSLIIQLSKGAGFASDNYLKMGFWPSRNVTFHTYPGLYHKTKIGILGAGKIGTTLISYLKPFDVEILVFDPFMSEERAQELGVTKTSLATLFQQSQVITNHIANNKDTVVLINYDLLKTMKSTAALINTGRGAQIVEEDLIRAMEEEPERYAVLDVTTVEPYPNDGPLRKVKNIYILPHIEGYAAEEVLRLSDYAILELHKYIENRPVDNPITLKQLKTMA